jgi:succinyl-CoA synthetase alpha subunit
MAIFLSENTRVLVQGITGRDGSFHTKQMLDYGTKIVAGVTPGKKGESVYGVPVYNSVKEAVKEKGANTSIIFVPAKFAQDAIYEAIDAGIKLIVVITEGIPALQMAEVKSYIKGSSRNRRCLVAQVS